MKQWQHITGTTLALAVSLSLAAQDQPKGGGGRPAPRGTDRVVQNQAPPPQSRPQSQPRPSAVPGNQFVAPRIVDRPATTDQQREANRPGRLHPFGARAGDWLRQYKDVPVDQQEKALGNDPSFQRLPADRQEKLRERLRQFNTLSPEKKDQLLDRMEKFETLPPEQRKRLHDIQEQMRQLSEERRQMVRRAFHQIKGMTPEQRQEFFGSGRFTNMFTEEEKQILRGLVEIEATPELAEPNPGDPSSED